MHQSDSDFDEFLKVLGLQTLIMQSNSPRINSHLPQQSKYSETQMNRTPNTKARDYVEALADFRKDDGNDIFIPMDSLKSSEFYKAANEGKAVGSRAILGASVFDYADFKTDIMPTNYAKPQSVNDFLTTYRVKGNFPREGTSKQLDYASVAKLHPSHGSSCGQSNNRADSGTCNQLKFQTVREAPKKIRTLNGATIVNGINLNNLKFVKPAPQCFKWDDKNHRSDQPNCRLWHPRELCKYYPNCTLTADVCGFGHPFCGEYCRCEPKNRSLQENHRFMPLHLHEAKDLVNEKTGNNNKNSLTTHR